MSKFSATLIFYLFLTISTSWAVDNKEYKNFQFLSDEEAGDIAFELEEVLILKAPVQDFLSIEKEQSILLEQCKQANAMLVFNQNEEFFINTCINALNNGAIDAGYILGHQLMAGQWITPDLTRSIILLENASNAGSRSAKRSLISYYVNPLMPFNDKTKALKLAKELSTSGLKWDQYILANLQASMGSNSSAKIGFNTLMKLANEGYKSAVMSAALVKIKKGPLQDIKGAKIIFKDADIKANRNFVIIEILIDVMEDRLASARKRLEKCYTINSACNNLYFNFLTKGIGGNRDLWKANDILERGYRKWPKIMAHNYAWNKATAQKSPIFNPKEAIQALSNIPKYKKNFPAVLDTIAAIYASNNNFELAEDFQGKAIKKLQNKGLGKIYDKFKLRLVHYQNKQRWKEPDEKSDFIDKIKSFNNLNETELELTSL